MVRKRQGRIVAGAVASLAVFGLVGTAMARSDVVQEPAPLTKMPDAPRHKRSKSADGLYDLPHREIGPDGKELEWDDEPSLNAEERDNLLQQMTPEDIERLLDQRLKSITPEEFYNDLQTEMMKPETNDIRRKFLRDVWQHLRKRLHPPHKDGPRLDKDGVGEVGLRLGTLMPEDGVALPPAQAEPEFSLDMNPDDPQTTLKQLLELVDHVGVEPVLDVLKEYEAGYAAEGDTRMRDFMRDLRKDLQSLATEREFHQQPDGKGHDHGR